METRKSSRRIARTTRLHKAIHLACMSNYVGGTCWERGARKHISRLCRESDLIDCFDSEDPNVVIVAMHVMTAVQGCGVFSQATQRKIITRLLSLLSSTKVNEYEYGGSQEEEDSVAFVSASAAECLRKLGYAPDRNLVYAKARKHGWAVNECQNID